MAKNNRKGPWLVEALFPVVSNSRVPLKTQINNIRKAYAAIDPVKFKAQTAKWLRRKGWRPNGRGVFMKDGIKLFSRPRSVAHRKAKTYAEVQEASLIFAGNLSKVNDETAEMLVQAIRAGRKITSLAVYQGKVKGLGSPRILKKQCHNVRASEIAYKKANPENTGSPTARQLWRYYVSPIESKTGLLAGGQMPPGFPNLVVKCLGKKSQR